MKNNTIKLTDEQLKLMNQIFDSINKLSKDKTFNEKLEIAYTMDDEDITEDNEEDFMQLINFTQNIQELTECNFNG